MKKGNSKLSVIITSIVAVILVITAVTLIKLFCIDNNEISTLLSDVTNTQNSVEKMNKETKNSLKENALKVDEAIDETE